MATESRNYTVPVLLHVLGIALGLYLGFLVMDAISPDLPDPDVEPGVSSSARPEAVLGGDADSLFRAINLGPALDQLDDQLTAGEGIVKLHITPGSMDSEINSDSIDGVYDAAEVPLEAPVLLGNQIAAERNGFTLDDVAYMDLVATAKGPRWYVQLDINRAIGPPPWTYGAPLEGEPLTVGPGPPHPVG
jgi:hypothetical protein